MSDSISFSINPKLLGSEAETPSNLREIHVKYRNHTHRITRQMIEANEIYRQEDLAAYVKARHGITFEIELEVGGQLLTPVSELFAETTPLIVNVVHKYIRNTNKQGKPIDEKDISVFFKERDINLQNDIIEAHEFQKCLEALKCDFTIDPKELKSLKNELFHTLQYEGASKGYLIRKVIEYAIESEPFFQMTSQYVISDQSHSVKAAYAVIQWFSDRAILISEDKDSTTDMYEGLILTLDQVRTYSLTEDGKKYPFVYGILSNFNEWKICCYYVPGPNTLETKKIFMSQRRLH